MLTDPVIVALGGVIPLLIAMVLIPGLNSAAWWRAPACWMVFVAVSICWFSILLPSISTNPRGLTGYARGLLISFVVGFGGGIALMTRFHFRARQQRNQRGFDVIRRPYEDKD